MLHCIPFSSKTEVEYVFIISVGVIRYIIDTVVKTLKKIKKSVFYGDLYKIIKRYKS